MVRVEYNLSAMGFCSHYDITNDNITGRYYIENDSMYVELKFLKKFIKRIFSRNKYEIYYVNEIYIHFIEREYFNCKGIGMGDYYV